MIHASTATPSAASPARPSGGSTGAPVDHTDDLARLTLAQLYTLHGIVLRRLDQSRRDAPGALDPGLLAREQQVRRELDRREVSVAPGRPAICTV